MFIDFVVGEAMIRNTLSHQKKSNVEAAVCVCVCSSIVGGKHHITVTLTADIWSKRYKSTTHKHTAPTARNKELTLSCMTFCP